jgi:hypothetical protein
VREEGAGVALLTMIDTSVKRPHKESSSMTNSKPKGKQPVEEEKKVPPELMRAG